jgi:uncharacterized protein
VATEAPAAAEPRRRTLAPDNQSPDRQEVRSGADRLFGSQARGDATLDSDLDLLVVVSDDRDRRELVRSIREVLADVAVSKDIFVTTPSLAARYGDVVGALVEPALREGVTDYAKS